MSELLIEFFSEEIQSNLHINARKQLENLLQTLSIASVVWDEMFGKSIFFTLLFIDC